jgi:DinB family protein
MFETGEPHTGVELVAALGRVQDEGDAYLRSLSPTLFFAPQGPAWSPAEHARHLVKSLRPLVRVLRWPRPVLGLLFGRHRGPGRDFAELRRTYQAALAAGGQAGRFAPSVQSPPADRAEGQQEVLARLAATVRAVQAAVERWPEPALDRYRLPHPLLERLTVREMLEFSVYHHGHHFRRVAERSQDGHGRGA